MTGGPHETSADHVKGEGIAGGVIENAHIKAAAAIAFSKLASTGLSSGQHGSQTGIPSAHHTKTGSGDIDHGSIGGLADDDHSQYLNTTRHDTTTRHSLGTVVPHDDHGALSGLADDDHSQYYNSTRHTLAIHTSLGLIIACDISPGSTHMTVTASGSGGSSNDFSRTDHAHGCNHFNGSGATPQNSTYGAGSPGTSGHSPSRDDHVHHCEGGSYDGRTLLFEALEAMTIGKEL